MALIAHAQQSRYHIDTLSTSHEVDIKDVDLSIDDSLELLQGAHIRLKQGVRYALCGRNGSGKSSIFQALYDGIIPGQPAHLKVVLLQQITVELATNDSVLDVVLQGDRERQALLVDRLALGNCIAKSTLHDIHAVVSSIKVRKAEENLEKAQLIAKRRSGARGKEARKDELQAEADLQVARDQASSKPSAEVQQLAVDMMSDIDLALDLMGSTSAPSRAQTILAGLAFTQDMISGPYTSLSGGWRQRASLAVALLISADILLLDEPSNFLDLEGLLWLEKFLLDREETVVVTSHDQTFLDNIAQETIILRNQKLKYFEGTPTACSIHERKELRRLTNDQSALDKKKEHIQKSIQQGISAGKKAGDDNKLKMAKSRQRKLDERFGIERSATGHRFKLNRDRSGYHTSARGQIEFETVEADATLVFPSPAKLRASGNLVHLDQISFRHPKQKTFVVQDISLTIPQNGRLALVGQNGQGKTTLIKILTGELKPTSGSIVRHNNLSIGYYSQHVADDLAKIDTSSALQHFVEQMRRKDQETTEQDARKALAAVGLSGAVTTSAPVSKLSGGQRVRLAFSLILSPPPSLLILDEPSAHLDLSTVRALSRALRSFTGALVVVTHDRALCRNAIEGLSYTSGATEDADEVESESDTDEEAAIQGEVYRLNKAKLQRLDRGINQYAEMMARKIAKRS